MWLLSGEIDIMEQINAANTIYGTLHFGSTSPTYDCLFISGVPKAAGMKTNIACHNHLTAAPLLTRSPLCLVYIRLCLLVIRYDQHFEQP